MTVTWRGREEKEEKDGELEWWEQAAERSGCLGVKYLPPSFVLFIDFQYHQ